MNSAAKSGKRPRQRSIHSPMRIRSVMGGPDRMTFGPAARCWHAPDATGRLTCGLHGRVASLIGGADGSSPWPRIRPGPDRAGVSNDEEIAPWRIALTVSAIVVLGVVGLGVVAGAGPARAGRGPWPISRLATRSTR